MEIDWQNIVALALVALAGAYLALTGWRILSRSKSSKCAGCSGVACGETSPEVAVVSMTDLGVGKEHAPDRRDGAR